MDLIFTSNSRSPASNGRFGASGAVARPKVCADLEVYRPSERQWKPRLRQAAGTDVACNAGKCVGRERNKNLSVKLKL